MAGATGAIGTPLLELLRAAGVSVVGMTRSEAGAERIRSLGAEPAIADALDRDAVARVVADAQPDAIVHQLTAIPPAINPRRAPRQFAQTNRLRTEGTRNLVDAAAGAKLIAQSIAFMYEPEGDAVKGEDAPLRRSPVSSFRPQIDALVELERTVGAAGGVVLRYGYFYGPGTSYARDGSIADMVRKRRFPIVGEGGGIFSFVHVRDAAEATVAALDAEPGTVLNVVDDHPAPVADWLPAYASVLGARAPLRVPVWMAKVFAGVYAVELMTRQRGASNQRAKATLGWKPARPSWRAGFAEDLA